MKTFNETMDMFDTLKKAEKAFDKSTVPCYLLESLSNGVSKGMYFIDRSKSAINEWPKLYKLIKEK